MPFIDKSTLARSLADLWATADHMLKIWFTLKQMGFREGGPPVEVTTSTPTPALKRLFSYGHPDGEFFVPFAATPRFATMKSDAARSIIQTNIKRWQESGSVVTIDPSNYIDFREGPEQQLLVSPGRVYPEGLGIGKNGFALEEENRVSIPLGAFAVWYGRQTEIPAGEPPAEFLISSLKRDLHLTPAEIACIFTQQSISVSTRSTRLSDADIYRVVSHHLNQDEHPSAVVLQETFAQHSKRIRTMVTLSDSPAWLRTDPETRVTELLKAGSKALLLYGPPRTGKTRAVDKYRARNDATRDTIQVHDGWGYDDLMISLRPTPEGKWDWHTGPLLNAIRGGKKLIVLEELNRTNATQALGEVFSLIEEAYRGQHNSLTLRDGTPFYVPDDLVFIATMNTIDKSVEDIDDALLARFQAVEFPPRIEALSEMLDAGQVPAELAAHVRELFAEIQEHYPLGHGYFATFTRGTDPILFYTTRIRPVLQAHLQGVRDSELQAIDNKVDQLFGV